MTSFNDSALEIDRSMHNVRVIAHECVRHGFGWQRFRLR
jgi:hypothetical protein